MKQQEANHLVFTATIVGLAVVLAVTLFFWLFLSARISIEVEPKNAVVTVDNAPISNSDGKASSRVKLGKHIIKVEADDYIGFKEEVTLSRGKNYSKKITLSKAPEPIEIAGSASNIAISGSDIFYQDPSDNLIYKVTTETNGSEIKIKSKQAITAKPIVADKIIWSPTRELLLLKRGTAISLFDFKKYDFLHQEEKPFGSSIGDIAWAPDNSRIAYYFAPPGNERSLIFSDASNQNIFRAVNLAELHINDPYLAFSPDSEWLVIIPRNNNFDENKIYLLNVYTKEIRLVNDAGNQKEAVFSADNQKIIYSTYSTDPNNPIHRDLSVMNLDGSDKKSLGIAARATDIRFWNDQNKIFLLKNTGNSKLELVDLINNNITDFFFKGQSGSNISEVILNNEKSGVIFISDGKLYFVRLEGND